MKISLAVPDTTVPRTAYYEHFAAAVRRNRRFVADPTEADICLPAEDMAVETNWPRYGNPNSAFVRGRFDQGLFNALRKRAAGVSRKTLHRKYARLRQMAAPRRRSRGYHHRRHQPCDVGKIVFKNSRIAATSNSLSAF
jgi:hypothetical protein